MKFSRNVFVFGVILLSASLSLAEDNNPYLEAEPYLNKYALASSDEKFDEVMETGFLTRLLDKIATPDKQLTEKDGEYNLKSESVFKNFLTKFKIGEKFDGETPDGWKEESVFTRDQNKLPQQVQDNNKTSTIVRVFTPEEAVIVDDLVAVGVKMHKLLNWLENGFYFLRKCLIALLKFMCKGLVWVFLIVILLIYYWYFV